MFAGITTVKSEDGNELEGMYSREGEYVQFNNNLKISDDSTIYVWLNAIEERMQSTLAIDLNTAIDQLELLDRVEQHKEFMEWIEKFPAQLVLLSMQISWSHKVEDSLDTKQGASLVVIED